MIYTSYFGKMKTIQAVDPSAVFIAVCGGLPVWWSAGQNFCWLRNVAPHWVWWSEWHEKFKDDYESDESKAWYGEKYRSTVLDTLDPADILSKIKDFAGDSNAYLLCYEAPKKFCHRHMLAAWLNRRINAGVKEWEQKNEDQK